jgi:Ca-activated chloride channel family protein
MPDLSHRRPGIRRRITPLLVVALVLVIPQSLGRAQEQSERYQFRVTVDLISLNVTVTDTRNHFVTDLVQDDFSVFEDGISQEISVFSREDLPIRMVLLIDTSASMDEKMTFAQEAAVNFVAQMKEDDVTEVMEFGSKPHVLQPFTANVDALTRAIRMTQAGGTTSLYNALYIALKNLSRRRQDIRRQAIVVLSDGEDTSSLVTFEQVMELTKDTDVTIYTISLRRQSGRRGRAFSEAEHVLKKLAEETGGQWFFPQEIGELESVYARIATELKSQYNIGYISNNPKRDGTWRRVVVQTDYPNLLVRAKLGYYAPTEP